MECKCKNILNLQPKCNPVVNIEENCQPALNISNGEHGTVFHDRLLHRDFPDQHPISAITGLQDSLERLSDNIIAENERAIAAEENLQDQIDGITASAVTDIVGGSNIGVERVESVVTVSTSTFVFEQGIASDIWVINHNLNKRPSIQLVDSSGRVFEADREYTNNNQVIIHLQSATTGFAYLN